MANNRPRSWGDTQVSLNMSPTVAQQLDLNLFGPQGDTLTVVRLIGRVVAHPNSLEGQLTGAMQVDIGIGVAANVAFALGTTGTPDLTVSSELPARGWLYRQRMLVMKDHATGTVNEQTYVDVLSFDLKASRKLDRGNLYVKFETNNSTGASTFDVRLTGIIRALILH